MHKREVVVANRIELERLYYEVHQALLKQQIKGKTASVKDMKYPQEEAQIESWYRKLNNIIESLENRKQMVLVSDYNTHEPDRKFWNISPKERKLLHAMAIEVREMLDRIVHSRHVPDGVSLGQNIEHVLKEGLKTVKDFLSYEHYLNGAQGKMAKTTAVKLKQSMVVSRNDQMIKGMEPGAAGVLGLLPMVFLMIHVYVASRKKS